MECPKCGGGCLLSEEELVTLLEERSRDIMRAIIKATYVCRACAERFSRLFVDDLAKRNRPPETGPGPYSNASPVEEKGDKTDPAEGLQFF